MTRWFRRWADLGSLDPWDLLPELAARGARPLWAWRDRLGDGWSLVAVGNLRAREPATPDEIRALLRAPPEDRDLAGRPAPRPELPWAWLGGGFRLSGPPTWGDWPPLALAVPRLWVARRGDRTSVALLAGGGPPPAEALERLRGRLLAAPPPRPPAEAPPPPLPADPDRRRAWREAVGAIAAGRGPDKAVLVREVRIPGRFDPVLAARALARTQPACTAFLVQRREAALVGATPEDILRVRGRALSTMALAGTRPRGPAGDDAAFAAHPKDGREHALVVQAIREALAPLADAVDLPAGPEIVSLRDLRHLRTPIRARLRPGADWIDALLAIHPSPAVAGSPRGAALAWIARHEPFERGWYAGPLGWLAHDEATVTLSLRAARIDATGASAWAGCGLVGGSDPAAEWREAEQKLFAVRRALAAARRSPSLPASRLPPAGRPP